MLFLTLLIGLFNLAVGYALAVRLGYGPPNLLDAWDALATPHSPSPPEQPRDATVPQPDATPVEEPLAAGPQDGTNPTPVPEPESPASSDSGQPEELGIESSLSALGVAMLKSGAKCTQLDTALRTPGQCDNPLSLHQLIQELRDDCQAYLTQLNAANERIGQRVAEVPDLNWLAEEVEIANLEQAAQIETTIGTLDQLGRETDVEVIRTRLFAEIRRLRIARHKLRDDQETAYAAIARHEGRLGAVDPQLVCDPLTNLPNRIGLEAATCHWWNERYHQTRQVGAVMLDVNGLGTLNEEHGASVVDSILQHVARLLQKHVASDDMLARYAGGRFLLLSLGTEPHASATKAERLRQEVEKTTFLHGEVEIRVTVSAAVTEARPDDSEDSLFARLTETTARAASDGGNASYHHNGTQPELIEPLDFGAEPAEIQI